MHDLIGVVVECVTKVDRVVSAWLIMRQKFRAWSAWGLVDDHGVNKA